MFRIFGITTGICTGLRGAIEVANIHACHDDLPCLIDIKSSSDLEYFIGTELSIQGRVFGHPSDNTVNELYSDGEVNAELAVFVVGRVSSRWCRSTSSKSR